MPIWMGIICRLIMDNVGQLERLKIEKVALPR